MTSDRMTRVNELLCREISGVLLRMVREPNVDLSAITVTRVVTSSDLRSARVFISIRDHVDERKRIMHILSRHRSEIQDHINKYVKLRFTPRLAFVPDESLERGDRVLSLLYRIEAEQKVAGNAVGTTTP